MIFRAVCTTCGVAGPSVRKTPGSTLLELVLWCVFLLPGIIYSVWRRTSTKNACLGCGNYTLIAAGAPNAVAMLASRGGWTDANEAAFLAALHRQNVARTLGWLSVGALLATIIGFNSGGFGTQIGGLTLIMSVICFVAFLFKH